MLRFFKALPLVFAIASLLLFAASCGTSSQTQVRAFQAISDAPPLDIAVNTTKVATTVSFTGFQPATGYTKVPSGTVTLQAYDTGTTTSIIGANGVSTSLGGSSQYTLLLAGLLNGTGATAPAFYEITDNNTAPATGTVEFRIINGSINTPTGGFDVYIVPPNTNLNGVSPQIAGLTLGQGSSYVSLDVLQTGYDAIVTQHGNQLPYIDQNYNLTAGQIRSLVVVDNGNQVSQFPIELPDLN